jgi:hypothetical protein
LESVNSVYTHEGQTCNGEPAKRLKYNWVALIGVGHGPCLHVMIKHFEYAKNDFCLCEDWVLNNGSVNIPRLRFHNHAPDMSHDCWVSKKKRNS